VSQHSNPTPSPAPSAAAVREVRYEYSRDFLPIMRHIGCSLLVSTYQATRVKGNWLPSIPTAERSTQWSRCRLT
jgi:hypothetical protein